MLKFGAMTTAIRIQRKKPPPTDAENVGVDENGYPLDEEWIDLINEDIPCEWKNKFGNDVYQAAAVNAIEPARIRLWYIPGITADCRIVKVDNGKVFEIIGEPDDVENRHQQLEIQVKRWSKG